MMGVEREALGVVRRRCDRLMEEEWEERKGGMVERVLFLFREW